MKKRHAVLGLLAALSVITFIDRMAIAVTGPAIQKDLGLTPSQWGWVLGAYTFAYAVFEVPSGAIGDRFGYRKELTRITVWWSFFTAITAACVSFWQLTAARFLFGLGAAGAYPNMSGVLYRWFPKRERARGQGVIWAASRLGGALAPLLLVPMNVHLGWQMVFVILGLIGFVWAILWWRWYHDRPADQPGITAEEVAEIGEDEGAGHSGTPWGKLLRLPQLWLIGVAYFFYAFGSWFFFGWFAQWMTNGRGFTPTEMAFYAAIPFLLGIVSNLIGGVLSDRLGARIGFKLAYRLITGICLSVTAALLLMMSLTPDKTMVVMLAAASFAVMDLMLPSAWAMCMSIGGRYGGTATGFMNMLGNLGGFICTVATGYIIAGTGSYDLPVQGIALMVLIAAGLFALIDSSKGFDQKAATA
ncbi:MFS transporter [Sphingomonas koreensis]|uniref:MFS transporter n=1 Tax=Sphingomonas koreensis TaxID=93064 RepID=UPI0008342DB7|nr:MFS transporter [Sphingomonas koreensis]PJI89330.1 sugar phosphate permease [Sphingomonas koreensis]RSU59243.1 MFS transporter [Sphingomonas koreensis]RSU68283.1 MFS transporter [Sphingomonas koreensis]